MNKSFTKGLLVSLAVASSLILSTSFCIQNLLVQNTANSHVVVQHEAEAVSTTSAKLSKSLRHTPVGTLGPKGVSGVDAGVANEFVLLHFLSPRVFPHFSPVPLCRLFDTTIDTTTPFFMQQCKTEKMQHL